MIALLSQMSRGVGVGYTPESGGGGGEPVNLIPLMLDGSHTYNGAAPVTVNLVGETYRSSIAGGDAAATTWYNGDEGRMDYVEFTGDFDVVASSVGLLTGADPGDFQFCGLICWLSATNYEFAVAGNRSPATSTIEYKATVSGTSYQNDIGTDAIASHVCDLRVARVGSTVTFYCRAVGATEWTTLPHSSLFGRVSFGTSTVRIGLLTYGYAFVAAFTGGCDSVVATTGTPS